MDARLLLGSVCLGGCGGGGGGGVGWGIDGDGVDRC